MENGVPHRTNEAWVEALRGIGEQSSEAAQDLAAYLRRVLAKVVRARFDSDDLGDLVQESLARILKSLDSFRGDSAFTTWATGIATRVAFTELRRRAVRARGTDAFDDVQEEVRRLEADAPAPDEVASSRDLTRALRQAISTQLTERQRVAILSELRGIPTIEIADRMETNQNALYKLTHDARKKLKAALLEAGFEAESIHELASEVSS